MIFKGHIRKNKHYKEIIRNNKVNLEILKWSKNGDYALNVVTVPYNTSDIFVETIFSMVNNNKRVLYISDEKEEDIELIKYFKNYTKFRNYSVFKRGVTSKADFIAISNDNLSFINDKFDLVIFNDINNFSKYKVDYIEKVLQNYKKDEGKVLSYAIEPVFKEMKEILVPVTEEGEPLCEPRIITTRLDLKKEIPYTLFEYLKWFLSAKRKIIIYVKSADDAEFIDDYMKKTKINEEVPIIKFLYERYDERAVKRFLLEKQGILVTDVYDKLCLRIKDVDIIVYRADEDYFNYKTLLYFCSKVSGSKSGKRGEVIFLSNNYSEDMEKARDIARNFNKEAWNNGLLEL